MSPPNVPCDDHLRSVRAMLSLEGLSIGDAFGERFFVRGAEEMIARRWLPAPVWTWTDDTEMATAIVRVLHERGGVDQDALAAEFARRFVANPYRGYGRGMHWLLQCISEGIPWAYEAPRLFDGSGSMGNGAAMRVAPLGAWYADDYERAAEAADASAAVTHHHREGRAGAVAVAVAAAWACRAGEDDAVCDPAGLFAEVLGHVSAGAVRDGIARAAELPAGAPVAEAVRLLGNGSAVTAADTVPFCLWCAARHIGDYAAALWATVSGLGDRDTTCAIVGGIVALSAGEDDIPADWRDAREPLHLDWHRRP